MLKVLQTTGISPLNLALLARQGKPKGAEGIGQGVGQCIPQQLVHWMDLVPIHINLVLHHVHVRHEH